MIFDRHLIFWVATLLVLGILTAVAEYVFRSRSERQP